MSKYFEDKSGGTFLDISPIGVVIAWPSATIPTGWLKVDGQALSTTTYPELFSVLGYSFGGSGATFYLPNIAGKRFIGAGTSINANPGTGSDTHVEETWNFGETKYDALETHIHDFNRRASTTSDFQDGSGRTGARTSTSSETSNNNSGNSREETRAKGLAINFIVKYK